MTQLEHIANQLAAQRNNALDSLAISEARAQVLVAEVTSLKEELEKVQQRLHDEVADRRA
jgi:hypothetical protein